MLTLDLICLPIVSRDPNMLKDHIEKLVALDGLEVMRTLCALWRDESVCDSIDGLNGAAALFVEMTCGSC